MGGGLDGRVSQRQTSVAWKLPVVDTRTIIQTFAWSPLGKLDSVGYPDDSGVSDPARTVTYSYDNGLLTGIPSFASSITYHENTMVSQVTHANGAIDTFGKDPANMARPRSIALSGANLGWSTGDYAYDGVGNIKAIGSGSSLQTFVYDPVSRLTAASILAGATTKSQSAVFDAFGNLTSTTTTDFGTQTLATSTSTNQLTAAGYDGSGNLTSWGGLTYSWDPLGQLTLVTGPNGINRAFLYTADGERVGLRNNTVGSTVIWVRDLGGQPLRLWLKASGGSFSWVKDYVLRDGRVLAIVDRSGTKHVHLDHLGTVRRFTDTTVPVAQVVGSRDSYPFGMVAFSSGSSDAMGFTGQERESMNTADTYDDLDYLHARYYNPVIARFLSVDPGRDWDPAAPQSWNLYAYVRNNPVNNTDPTGMLSDEVANRVFMDVKTVKQFDALVTASQDMARLAGVAVTQLGDPTKTGSATAGAVAAGESAATIAGAVVVDTARAASGVAVVRTGAAVVQAGATATKAAAAAVAAKAQPIVDSGVLRVLNLSSQVRNSQVGQSTVGKFIGGVGLGVMKAQGMDVPMPSSRVARYGPMAGEFGANTWDSLSRLFQ